MGAKDGQEKKGKAEKDCELRQTFRDSDEMGTTWTIPAKTANDRQVEKARRPMQQQELEGLSLSKYRIPYYIPDILETYI